MNKIPEHIIERIKEYYVNNDVTFSWLSKNARELFGVDITLDNLKWHSKSDLDGSWPVQRTNRGRVTREVPITEKLEVVADKLYELIVDDTTSSTSIAQIARTWLEIITKAKMDQTATARTDIQQVQDLIEKTIAQKNE